MSVFAFVFARGGSKGLPGKNIKLLNGLPLLAHSIRLAQSIDRVSEVFVSTDCDKISQIAEDFNATVIKRPAELASDVASEWHAWRHAVNHVRGIRGDFQTFLSLPATSPLRAKIDVETCLDTLKPGCDMVITVTPSSRNPYFNMVRRADDGKSNILLGEASVIRRQDAPQAFDIVTVAYVTRPQFILEKSGLFDGTVNSVIVPKERAVDIDDIVDFKLAEALITL